MDGEYEYTIMCDLEYPGLIHKKTVSFPLAPAWETVTAEDYIERMLVEYKQTYPTKGRSGPTRRATLSISAP